MVEDDFIDFWFYFFIFVIQTIYAFYLLIDEMKYVLMLSRINDRKKLKKRIKTDGKIFLNEKHITLKQIFCYT